MAKPKETRQERIDRIRSEIKAGTFNTEEKFAIAIKRMINDIERRNNSRFN